MHGPAARPCCAPPRSRQCRARGTALCWGMLRQLSDPRSASEETSVTSVLLCCFPVVKPLTAQDKRSCETRWVQGAPGEARGRLGLGVRAEEGWLEAANTSM